MKTLKYSAAVLGAAFLAACSNPADNVPAAQVSSGTETTNPAAAPAMEGRSFAITPASSKIEFIGSKVTGSHNGGFTNFTGELKVTDGKLVGSGNRVVIDISSLWSDNDRLTGHLKSPDFFDAPKYPTAVFETSSITGEGANTTVAGNLTLHGVTKQISFPAHVQVSEDKVLVNADFAINRHDFQMQYAGKADDLIRKEVVLKLNVIASPGNANFSPFEKAPAPASSAGQ